MAWDMWQQRQISRVYTRITDANEDKITPDQLIMIELGRAGIYG